MHQRPIGGRPRRPMAQQPPPQNGARSDAGDAGQLGHSFKAATSNGLLMPSQQAYWALLLLPCVGWLLAVVSGMLHSEGVAADKRAVHHELTWFDRNVFRTVAGPSLVLLVLLLRCLVAYLSAAANSKARAVVSSEAALDTELTPLASTATVSSGTPLGTSTSATTTTPVAHSAIVTSSTTTTVGVRALPQPTLPGFCVLAYALVAGMRIVMYGMHLALIRYTAKENNLSAKEVPSYLSDHLLLGASVVTSLQVELICAVSDKTKLDVLGLPLVWHILTCCAGLVSLLLSCLVTADMYFTAKFFHHPQESLVALVIGAVSLQGPLLCCLHCQKYTVCKSSNSSERS